MGRIIKNSDVVSGAALIVFGVVALALSLDISRGPEMLTVPPNFVPLLCSGGILISGFVVLIRALRSERSVLPVVLDRSSAGVAICIALYYWFFKEVDFRIGTWAFTLAVMFIMGCRSWKQLLIYPLAISGGVYLVFRYVFEILLPVWN